MHRKEIVRKETWKEGIKLSDLKEGDTIYIQKLKNGFNMTLECSFIKFEKGLVYAKIIQTEYDWWDAFPKGEIIRVRQKKCYLWGKNPKSKDFYHQKYPYCHWCKKGVFE